MSKQQQASYQPPEFDVPIDLQLSRNESTWVVDEDALRLPGCSVSRYPSMSGLQEAIGDRLKVSPERIVISAGGDDSLDRVIRLSLRKSPKILTHAPSFEMVDVYSDHYNGALQKVEWTDGDFPTAAFLQNLDPETGLAIIVTPNNPTGLTVPAEQIQEIATAAAEHDCRLLVDNAYIEFADEDPTDKLLNHGNIMILRTFSKAWGMAGLRVGYLIAPNADEATEIRNASGPFPVARTSLLLAENAVRNSRDAMRENVSMTKHFRQQLQEILTTNGLSTLPSEGNFLLLKDPNAEQIWERLTSLGIAVRKFPGRRLLKNCLRITIPSRAADFLRLAEGLSVAIPFPLDTGKLSILPSSETSVPDVSPATERVARVERKTKETEITVDLNLDGSGNVHVETGIGFLDHMLTAFAFHSRFDLELKCQGDLHIDDHHTAEDCALALGSAIDQALGPRTGIVRFGFAYAPLDESLARTVLDLSGRPWPSVHLQLQREMLGTLATENVSHVFISLAMALKCSLHVDVLRGDNDHHKAEAAFKSMALAFRQAVKRTVGAVPSTKGVL